MNKVESFTILLFATQISNGKPVLWKVSGYPIIESSELAEFYGTDEIINPIKD